MKTQIPPIARLLLAILMCLPICGNHAFAQEAESYAVFTKATNTLRFKHDTNKPNRAFALNDGENAPGWYDKLNVNTIEKVIFDASFANARPTSCYKWFDGCKNLTTIDGIEYLNTENVTNMSGMFRDCSALTTLNVSNLDTKNVTSMSEMFYGCYALTTLDVSHFDTKNVTDMSGMFSYCRALRTLDVSNFDTKNVTDMSSMFSDCSALTTLDVSNFNTQNVTDMGGMFSGCRALTTLDVSNFDTKNVTDMSGMFSGCRTLTTLDVSNFDTKNVTDMSGMFGSCTKLKTLDVSSFNTQNVTDMSWMFSGCKALTTLDVSKFDTKNVTDMSGMFAYNPALRFIFASEKFVTTACKKDEDMFVGCTNLVGTVPYDKNKVGKEMANYTTGYFKYYKASIFASFYAVFDEATSTLTFKHDNNRPIEAFVLNEGSKFPGWYKYHDDISKVVFDTSFANARPTSCYRWFWNCNDLTTIEGIEYLNTQNVTNMGFMFNGCSALRTLDLSSFDTKNVTNMEYMFYGCPTLETLDLSNFDTKNVTNMEYMFKGCSALNTLNLSSFDTQNMTNIQSMFKGCSALTTLDLSNFDTKNVTDMGWMFHGCEALTTLDLSNFDTKNVTDMGWMFHGCEALTTIYASEKYVTTACEYYNNMFAGCTNLVGAVPYDRNKVGKEMANYTTGYFTYKAPTGIDAPTVSDDTTAEYYDLQGRRLNAPQKGVNIVKRGKKATKILVK